MKRWFCILTCALLGACSRGDNALGRVIVGGILIGAALEEANNPRPMPSLSDHADLVATPQAAPLAPQRVVHEQDCAKPIEKPGANLRCR